VIFSGSRSPEKLGHVACVLRGDLVVGAHVDHDRCAVGQASEVREASLSPERGEPANRWDVLGGDHGRLGYPRTLLDPLGVQPGKLDLVRPSSWRRNGGEPRHAPSDRSAGMN
jgi:hypothetical protein